MVVEEITYYDVLIFGSGAIILAGTLSSFFTGRGATRVVMAVDSTAAALNAVLAYLWIFGHGGFPRGGIAGAARPRSAAEWFRVICYSAIMLRPRYRPYRLASGWRWNRRLMRRLWTYGGPGGLQWLVECGSFTLFITLVGGLGKINQAGTMLAFNVNSVAWVPMMGVGLAVSTMVGQQLGANRPDMAARATWTAFVLAMIYMCTMSLFYVTVPDWFLMGHAAGMAPEQFEPLRELIVVLLRFVAVYCLFDAMNVVFISAIRGAGDTRFVFWTSLGTSLLPLSLAWLGIHYLGQGLLWCWTLITLWVCSAGFIYLARFLQGKWRTMRVIETSEDLSGDESPVFLQGMPTGSLRPNPASRLLWSELGKTGSLAFYRPTRIERLFFILTPVGGSSRSSPPAPIADAGAGEETEADQPEAGQGDEPAAESRLSGWNSRRTSELPGSTTQPEESRR